MSVRIEDKKAEIDEFFELIGADKLLEDVLFRVQFPAQVPAYFSLRKGDDNFSLNLQGINRPRVFAMGDIVRELEKDAGMDACWLYAAKMLLEGLHRKMGSRSWSTSKGDFTDESEKNWHATEPTIFL